MFQNAHLLYIINYVQVHFFPAIANVKQLKEQFEIRGCSKVTN
jgi:hypothetical protein